MVWPVSFVSSQHSATTAVVIEVVTLWLLVWNQ